MHRAKEDRDCNLLKVEGPIQDIVLILPTQYGGERKLRLILRPCPPWEFRKPPGLPGNQGDKTALDDLLNPSKIRPPFSRPPGYIKREYPDPFPQEMVVPEGFPGSGTKILREAKGNPRPNSSRSNRESDLCGRYLCQCQGISRFRKEDLGSFLFVELQYKNVGIQSKMANVFACR
jgi:hypothetical protein